MIACIDGGLFCIGIPALLAILFPALGLWLRKRFKWCKKSCACKCHPANLTPVESMQKNYLDFKLKHPDRFPNP
jgi:hypothetical protein